MTQIFQSKSLKLDSKQCERSLPVRDSDYAAVQMKHKRAVVLMMMMKDLPPRCSSDGAGNTEAVDQPHPLMLERL